MSRLRSRDHREAISDLLTVTMYLQDSLSRLHRQGLPPPKKTFVSTWRVRRLAPLRFTNPRAAELSVHSTIVPSEQLHILLHWSIVAIPSEAPPTSAINSDSPELKQTIIYFLEDAQMGYHVFSTEPLTQTAIPE